MGVNEQVNETLHAQTMASAEQIRAAGKRAAEAAQVKLTSTVREKGAAQDRIVYQIMGPGNVVQQIEFAVSIGDVDGRRSVTVAIQDYKTIRPVMFGFIPAGPKSLVGLKAYRKFMVAFQTELAALS